MANIRRPRKGSLQFWPRARAKKEAAVVKSWAPSKNLSILGFAGYKAGMTHVLIKDTRSGSRTKGDVITWPVTVLECPPIKVFSIRFYGDSDYGSRVIAEVFNTKADKELARKVKLPKNYNYEEKLKLVEAKLAQISDVFVNVYTQPKKTGIGKKRPEIFEMAIGGNDIKAKIEYAKSLFDKEIKVSDILKQGGHVDVHAVTAGKGFQGVVKRFGVAFRSHKAEKGQRHMIYGPTKPAKVIWGMHMAGKMGYNTRTEYNKGLLLISDKPERVNPKGGFTHYGIVKNDFVLIHGSIPGPVKRLVRLVEPIRGQRPIGNVEIQSISLESKQ